MRTPFFSSFFSLSAFCCFLVPNLSVVRTARPSRNTAYSDVLRGFHFLTGVAKMMPSRLQNRLENRSKMMTRRLKSGQGGFGATFAPGAPARLPTFSRVVSQDRVRSLPWGLFGVPLGTQEDFGGSRGGPRRPKILHFSHGTKKNRRLLETQGARAAPRRPKA